MSHGLQGASVRHQHGHRFRQAGSVLELAWRRGRLDHPQRQENDPCSDVRGDDQLAFAPLATNGQLTMAANKMPLPGGFSLDEPRLGSASDRRQHIAVLADELDPGLAWGQLDDLALGGGQGGDTRQGRASPHPIDAMTGGEDAH